MNKLAVQFGAVRQSIFSIVAEVDSTRVGQLEAYLADIDNALLKPDSMIAFGGLEMLHFCSFTLFYDDYFGSYIVFESNIDGCPDDYVDGICNIATPVLHTIFGFCIDYFSPEVDVAFLRGYLRRHMVHAVAAFVGNIGRSVRQIQAEAALVAEIHTFLDRVQSSEKMSAEVIVAAVRGLVRQNNDWDWVWRTPARLTAQDRVKRWAPVMCLVAIVFLAFPICLLVIGVFLIALRCREITDSVEIVRPIGRVLELTAREDRIGQNHMASLCYVKPGAFRRRTLRIVLSLANLLARVSTNGTLSGLDSLHFAHWSLINDGRRLLFLTNYDGSWENYLDDFIEKAAFGLTAIWSNTLNFPRTLLLFFDGARNERDFKAIARTTQAYTNVWYAAYPGLTVSAIEKNSAICEGLRHTERSFKAAAWLRRF